YTRANRVVYGGGGITPDLHIPWHLELNKASRLLLNNAKRPLFNWGAKFLSEHKDDLSDYHSFQIDWTLSDQQFESFVSYLKTEQISFDSLAVEEDKDYLKNMLKAEIAGANWGHDEELGIRRMFDNQVMSALEHFSEAEFFINN
ncbi:MAG: hypothetical protein HQ528_06020, partial [Candidatus Marinimicrobia bacterium]|nr:hypothetical protein [Candidatus Neomarinimicrobiota bacterium]